MLREISNTQIRMPRAVHLLIAAAAALLVVATPVNAAMPGQKRCYALDSQLFSLLARSKAASIQARAETLGHNARALCSQNKTAQGLRAYAKALNLLGAQPILPKD